MIGIILLVLILIALLIVMNVGGNKPEPFIVVPKTDTFNECAKVCKETVNCHGFVFDINDKCIIYGDEVNYDYVPPENIACNKVQPINKFKFHEAPTHHNKLLNSIYKCKSGNRYIQMFSNGDKLTNITGLVNYRLNNNMIDYDLKDIGVIE